MWLNWSNIECPKLCDKQAPPLTQRLEDMVIHKEEIKLLQKSSIFLGFDPAKITTKIFQPISLSVLLHFFFPLKPTLYYFFLYLTN